MIWISANIFGYRLLQEAIKHTKLDCIITLSSQSKTKMYDSVPMEAWYKFGVDVLTVDDINDSNILKDLHTDYIFMCGWRQMLDIPKRYKNKIIGFHPTLLPFGRGTAPIINTILGGIKQSGVTMFFLNDKIDAGDIIGQERIIIGKEDYAWDIYMKCIDAGTQLIHKHLPEIINETVKPIKQDESKATYFHVPLSNEIKHDDNIETMNRKIRAFSYPYDGAYLMWSNKKVRIMHGKIEMVGEKKNEER